MTLFDDAQVVVDVLLAVAIAWLGRLLAARKDRGAGAG